MSSPSMLLRRLDEAVRGFVSLFLNVRRLRKRGSQVLFSCEGGMVISIPEVRYRDLLSPSGRTRIRQVMKYVGRPTAETLLRSTVFGLLRSGYLDPRRSIIDIGSWIGDNAVVWARLLAGQGVVYAVDPSRINLDFGKAVAAESGVTNIKWVQAVCADQAGLAVSLCGDLEHAQFSDSSGQSSERFSTTTLDDVVAPADRGSIALMHVDVEGFEKKVLLGAKQIISQSMPVIVFEQHISKEDTAEVVAMLAASGYKVFMINEVIPGCDLDCRNFIAFPPGRDLPPSAQPQHFHGRQDQVWYACLGPTLLPVN